MGVPHITAFCWCMGLEVGAKCVGLLHLAVSIALMVLCSVFADHTRSYVGTADDLGDNLYSTWYKISISAAVVSVVHIILAVTLLVSVFKRITTGLRVWVYVMSILYVVVLVCIVVFVAKDGFNGTGSDIFLAFLEGLLFFGILAYCILCVNSYYLMLKSAQDMEGPNKTQY